MTRAVMAIDPGKKGALVLLSEDGKVEFAEWDDERAMFKRLAEWSAQYNVVLVALEHVWSRGGEGAKSAFSFGYNNGWWTGVLLALNLPFRLVVPQEWQKGRVRKRKKSEPKSFKPSFEVAERLYPYLELRTPIKTAKTGRKTGGRLKDGVADALLIAEWGWAQVPGGFMNRDSTLKEMFG